MYSPVNFNSPVNQVQFACHKKNEKYRRYKYGIQWYVILIMFNG